MSLSDGNMKELKRFLCDRFDELESKIDDCLERIKYLEYDNSVNELKENINLKLDKIERKVEDCLAVMDCLESDIVSDGKYNIKICEEQFLKRECWTFKDINAMEEKFGSNLFGMVKCWLCENYKAVTQYRLNNGNFANLYIGNIVYENKCIYLQYSIEHDTSDKIDILIRIKDKNE